MITGLIPSSYLLEVTGKPVKSIVPGSFDIDKINVSSKLFTNDLDARSALTAAIKYLSPNAVQPVEAFNPQFFPNMDPIEIKDDSDEIQIDDLQDNESEKIFVPISKNFDEIGDFVMTRAVKKSSTYSIIGRVMASPSWYAADFIENKLGNRPVEKVTIN